METLGACGLVIKDRIAITAARLLHHHFHPLDKAWLWKQSCLTPILLCESFPMEWFEGRITKRSVVAAEAPKTPDAIAELAYKADKLDPSLVRESMLELALKHQHSVPNVENLKAELSVSFAINRGFRQQLEAEMEANGKLSAELKHEIAENKRLNAEIEKLNAAIKHECKDNEKLNATLTHEREENARLNAALTFTLLENAKLLELTRSLREQADGLDGLRAVLEIIADEIKPKARRRRLLALTNTSGPSLLPRGAPAHP
jgi:hypothetical protein